MYYKNKKKISIPITVKCRLGVDDQNIESDLDNFVYKIFESGVNGLWVHARKAILTYKTISNLNVPPLNYERVIRLKKKFPNFFIGINGGISDINTIQCLLSKLDGVMVGRAAYHRPIFIIQIKNLINNKNNYFNKSQQYYSLYKALKLYIEFIDTNIK